MKKKNYTLEAQKALNERQDRMNRNEQAKTDSLNEAIMNNANRSYSSVGRNRKLAVAEIAKENEYYTNVFNEAMIEIFADIVDSSLVLDEDYTEINPNYRLDLEDILENIFNQGDINTDVTNEDTVAVFEAVYISTPLYEEAKDEDIKEVSKKVAGKAKDKADKAINSLISDTKGKVVDTLQNEKKQADSINKDIEKTLKEDFNGFYKEENSVTLFEMLCANDAKVQIQESGEYNSELAVSNGILSLTILEALNAAGLVKEENQTNAKIKNMLLY